MSLDASVLNKIVEMREMPRPLPWIVRETGVSERDVKTVLRLAGDKSVSSAEMDAERFDEIRRCLDDGWTASELRQTFGTDHRTVKRWFPDYRPLKNGSEEWREYVRLAKRMKALEERDW